MEKKQDKIQLMVIEDNPTMLEGLEKVLDFLGYRATGFQDAETALGEIPSLQPEIIICDYKLPGMNGIELLEAVRKKFPGIEVVLITAFGSIELAVQAMQKGAVDFITKPFSADEIGVKLERIVERLRDRREMHRLAAENQYLRNQVDDVFNYGEIIGKSAVMQQIYRTIQKVAPTDATVMIYGESGTGKELVARAVHKNSHRRDKPFIKVNCGALAEGVLESELFGHEKGAFTGALRQKPGRFELADTGSIFLDEIGDIPLATQVKLLRVLQEKTFERVGGETTLHVDVRIIAATNRDLQKEVEEGRFREDLYYRLHIVPITLPPLRDRVEDIPLLVHHFLQRLGRELGKPDLTLDEPVMQALQAYHWPGNVRELENVLERAAVLCEGNRITLADLPRLFNIPGKRFPAEDEGLNLNQTLEQVEKDLLQRAMERAKGVKTEAAKILGIKTNTLFYKLEKYGLE